VFAKQYGQKIWLHLHVSAEQAEAVRVAELEAFWPSRRLNAFDGLCRPVAPSRAAGSHGRSRP
jgi:hypothetical protein